MPVSNAKLRRFLRNEGLRQTPVPPNLLGVTNVGFGLKPTGQGSYVNRVRGHFLAMYVLRGSGTHIDWTGREHRVRAGHLMQMPPGRPHGVVHDGDGRWAECYVALNTRFWEVLCEMGSLDPSRPVLDPGLDLSLVMHFDQLLRMLKTPSPGRYAQGLVRAHELLVEVQRQDRTRRAEHSPDEMIENARYLLGGDLHRPLDVRVLARGCHMSYERFRKRFKERVGVSPHRYRIQRRIEQARSLLAEEGLSIKETADALGYPDAFCFAKQFRKVAGISPGAFRRSLNS